VRREADKRLEPPGRRRGPRTPLGKRPTRCAPFAANNSEQKLQKNTDPTFAFCTVCRRVRARVCVSTVAMQTSVNPLRKSRSLTSSSAAARRRNARPGVGVLSVNTYVVLRVGGYSNKAKSNSIHRTETVGLQRGEADVLLLQRGEAAPRGTMLRSHTNLYTVNSSPASFLPG